jgi:outer membrane immunogenic protein
MKKFLIASAALVAMGMSVPAMAADMPVKAYAPAPVEYGWTGFYVGGSVGSQSYANNWTTTCVQGGAPLALCGSALNNIIFPGAPDSTASSSLNTSSFRPGIYAGAQVQANSVWVLGFEADIGFYNHTRTVAGLLGCSTAACTGGALVPFDLTGDSTSVRNKNDASFRLRAGYLVMPNLLAYGTAGIARTSIETSMSCTGATSPGCLFNHSQTIFSTLTGYTVGGGLEWRMFQNWLLRGEYRYSDYGTVQGNFFVGSGDIELLTKVHVTSQTASVGLAYLFGWK